MCRTKGQKKQNVNAVEQDDYAFTVNDDNVPEKLAFSVGGIQFKMLIDSGATSNVMGENIWEKVKAEKIKCHLYSFIFIHLFVHFRHNKIHMLNIKCTKQKKTNKNYLKRSGTKKTY